MQSTRLPARCAGTQGWQRTGEEAAQVTSHVVPTVALPTCPGLDVSEITQDQLLIGREVKVLISQFSLVRNQLPSLQSCRYHLVCFLNLSNHKNLLDLLKILSLASP